jgi:hypothetical protein
MLLQVASSHDTVAKQQHISMRDVAPKDCVSNQNQGWRKVMSEVVYR